MCEGETHRDDLRAVSELLRLGLEPRLEHPQALLAEHTATLDAAYREVGARLGGNDAVSIDDDGKIHLTGVKAIEEPPSLFDRPNGWGRCSNESTCPR